MHHHDHGSLVRRQFFSPPTNTSSAAAGNATLGDGTQIPAFPLGLFFANIGVALLIVVLLVVVGYSAAWCKMREEVVLEDASIPRPAAHRMLEELPNRRAGRDGSARMSQQQPFQTPLPKYAALSPSLATHFLRLSERACESVQCVRLRVEERCRRSTVAVPTVAAAGVGSDQCTCITAVSLPEGDEVAEYANLLLPDYQAVATSEADLGDPSHDDNDDHDDDDLPVLAPPSPSPPTLAAVVASSEQ
ncbi:hypothetical protein BC828DRAFT_392006 [Blastocladiella britannica]|nr:hypothetical protein BC828DRAFT_392006 [Blastocladiella britannica]